MIDRNKKIIFIHIPRTGGTSVEKVLMGKIPNYKNFCEEFCWGVSGCEMTQHWPLYKILEFCQADKNDYFKFSFVRNPFDRLVSVFCYLKSFYEKRHSSFDGWLRFVCDKAESSNYRYDSHEAPQSTFFQRDDLDFLGRFENFEKDFSAVLEKLEISAKIPHINQSHRNKNYMDYFNKEARKMVENAYRTDFELFEYAK